MRSGPGRRREVAAANLRFVALSVNDVTGRATGTVARVTQAGRDGVDNETGVRHDEYKCLEQMDFDQQRTAVAGQTGKAAAANGSQGTAGVIARAALPRLRRPNRTR